MSLVSVVSAVSRALRQRLLGLAAIGPAAGATVTVVAVAAVAVAITSVAQAQDVEVRASVDRAELHVNESFTYILRAEGRVRGEPDSAPLAELFDIRSSSQSTQIQIVNGQAQQTAVWVYQLMPRETGRVLIPPVEVAGRFSNEVEVNVLPALAQSQVPGDVFLEADLSDQRVYVQAQAIYTLRLFVRAATGRATITPPQISGGEAIVERLGPDSQYRVTRVGREFEVTERRFAIFPQEAGTLEIGPAVFEAMVRPSVGGFSRMERYRSETLELRVEPAVPPPPPYRDAAWLPSTHVELSERWSRDPPSLVAGEPTSLELRIEAEGLLETQLPDLSRPQANGMRLYADRPELESRSGPDGFVSTRTERFAVLPQAAGPAELSAIELPWFNVTAGQWEVARLDPRAFEVAPGQLPAAVRPAPVTPAEPTLDQPSPAVPVPAAGRIWPLVSAVLGVGWGVTLLFWWRSGRRAGPIEGEPAVRPVARGRLGRRDLLKRVRDACAREDAEAARSAVLEWAARHFGDDPPRTLGALAARLTPDVAVAVLGLEAALYAPGGRKWDGAALAAALERAEARASGSTASGDDPLLPLYR